MEEGTELVRNEDGKWLHKSIVSIVKSRAGRPRFYPTPQLLIDKALEYFEWTAETKNKVTSAGIRIYLGINSRTLWKKYKDNPEYTNAVELIEALLEADWEAKLGWAGSTQGAIFWLKNKSGWRDESTVNNNLSNVTANFGTTISTAQESTGNTQLDNQ